MRFRDFILALCLGIFPGLVVMTFFGDHCSMLIHDPNVEGFLILVGLTGHARAVDGMGAPRFEAGDRFTTPTAIQMSEVWVF